MNKICDYTVVREKEAEAFEKVIRGNLSNGWELYGNFSFVFVSNSFSQEGGKVYLQAMVKRQE